MGKYYTVRAGDNLSKIARAHGISGASSWRVIYFHPKNSEFRRRRTDPNHIRPGDVIYVPAPPSTELLDSAGPSGFGAPAIITRALELDQVFQNASNATERVAVATELVQLYERLDAMVAQAPLDSIGLPLLPGVTWDRFSPLAGMTEDIVPFGAIDQWVSGSNAVTVRRSRPRPSRRRTHFVDFTDADVVMVTRSRSVGQDRQPAPPPSIDPRLGEEFEPTSARVIGRVGDVLGAVSGVTESALALGAVGGTALAATEVTGLTAGIGGILFGYFDSIDSGFKNVARRGCAYGYAYGLQEVAEQYLSISDTTPVALLPAPRRPRGTILGRLLNRGMTVVQQRYFSEGFRKGLEAAWNKSRATDRVLLWKYSRQRDFAETVFDQIYRQLGGRVIE
jgi:hypothetical protein